MWAGSWQASAFTSITWTGVNVGGRPLRARSTSPSSPSAANRPRHLRTVSTVTAHRRAIAALDKPRAASSTIRARSLSRDGLL